MGLQKEQRLLKSCSLDLSNNWLTRSVQLIQDPLDEIDKKILAALLKDGRKKFTEIAKELDVTTSKIKKQVLKCKSKRNFQN